MGPKAKPKAKPMPIPPKPRKAPTGVSRPELRELKKKKNMIEYSVMVRPPLHASQRPWISYICRSVVTPRTPDDVQQRDGLCHANQERAESKPISYQDSTLNNLQLTLYPQ